jgi:L-asparagine transporter-like permease|tara:strand:+ start:375 stop:614 length:240 start_codon:yes stop_codon:yes gene_type:complete
MDILITLISCLLVIGAIALWKYRIPSLILWGGILIIIYLGFVVNELYSKDFDEAIHTFPLVGILGLILLIIGIFIKFKK